MCLPELIAITAVSVRGVQPDGPIYPLNGIQVEIIGFFFRSGASANRYFFRESVRFIYVVFFCLSCNIIIIIVIIIILGCKDPL